MIGKKVVIASSKFVSSKYTGKIGYVKSQSLHTSGGVNFNVELLSGEVVSVPDFAIIEMGKE